MAFPNETPQKKQICIPHHNQLTLEFCFGLSSNQFCFLIVIFFSFFVSLICVVVVVINNNDTFFLLTLSSLSGLRTKIL